MKVVVYDKEWLDNAPDFDLYYMYRGVEEHRGIRYDITVIPAKTLGREFAKTKGHYHVGRHQEVYTVLEGQAIYLLQKKLHNIDDEIEDVYAVKCQKGDVVVIPSYYGHVTINPSETEELKMANWIFSGYKSDYAPFENLQGACWYYTQEGWVKNERYKLVPELRWEEPLKTVPKDLEFLKLG